MIKNQDIIHSKIYAIKNLLQIDKYDVYINYYKNSFLYCDIFMKKDNFEKIFPLEYSKLNGLITSYLIYNYVCELETSFSIEYSIRKSEV